VAVGQLGSGFARSTTSRAGGEDRTRFCYDLVGMRIDMLPIGMIWQLENGD
jgi:hypothetical protein